MNCVKITERYLAFVMREMRFREKLTALCVEPVIYNLGFQVVQSPETYNYQVVPLLHPASPPDAFAETGRLIQEFKAAFPRTYFLMSVATPMPRNETPAHTIAQAMGAAFLGRRTFSGGTNARPILVRAQVFDDPKILLLLQESLEDVLPEEAFESKVDGFVDNPQETPHAYVAAINRTGLYHADLVHYDGNYGDDLEEKLTRFTFTPRDVAT